MKIALFALAVAVAVLVDGAPQKEGGPRERLENFAGQFPKGKGGPDGAPHFDFKKFNLDLLKDGKAVLDGITGLEDKIDLSAFLANLEAKIRPILVEAKVPAEFVEKAIKMQAKQVKKFVEKSDVVPTVGDVVKYLVSQIEEAESQVKNYNPADAKEHFKKFQSLVVDIKGVLNSVTNLEDELVSSDFVKAVGDKIKAALEKQTDSAKFIEKALDRLKDDVEAFVRDSTTKQTVGDAVKFLLAKLEPINGHHGAGHPDHSERPRRSAEDSNDEDDESNDNSNDDSSSEDVDTKKGKKEKADKKEKKEKKVKKHGKNQAEAEDEDATNTRERRAADFVKSGGDKRKHGGAGRHNNTAQDGSENKGHGHGHHGKGNNSTSTDAGAGQPRGKFDFAAIAQAFGGIKGNHTKGGKGKHSRP